MQKRNEVLPLLINKKLCDFFIGFVVCRAGRAIRNNFPLKDRKQRGAALALMFSPGDHCALGANEMRVLVTVSTEDPLHYHPNTLHFPHTELCAFYWLNNGD